MLSAWSAVSTLDRMFRDEPPRGGRSKAEPAEGRVTDLYDVMGSAFGTATSSRGFDPMIDVHANDSEVVLYCDVPGVRREDLEITLENHVLTIKGDRKFDSKPGEQVMLGRAYGTFRRSFALPSSLDEDRLTADLDDGVLTLRVPKHPKAQPRRISLGPGREAASAKQLEE